MSNINTQALVTLTAQGAGTVNSADLPNGEWRGISLAANLTATGSVTVTVGIWGKDGASGLYYLVAAFSGISLSTTNSITALQLYPGITSSGVAASSLLPATYRVQAVITGAGTVTGTIGGSLIQ